ncbi:MAG: LamG-like jellyroll fold domain-containing protein, partial [Saprospiraceae bacterium]
ENTNVDKILQIDLLKTDFFRQSAFSTYLFFNPYSQVKAVQFAVGAAPVDIYDAVSETFLQQSVTGTVNLYLPANAALLVTLTPAGGAITYDRNKMLVNGTVVDYRQTAQPYQYAPRIQGLAVSQPQLEFGDTTTVFSKTFDQDSNNFTWTWSATGGTLLGTGAEIQWVAPTTPGNYQITLIVADESGQRDTAYVTVLAVAEINLAPQIVGLEKTALYVAPGGNVVFTALASDPNGDPLTFNWTADGGTLSGSGNARSWTAPATEGIFQITVTATDPGGMTAQASTSMLVKNFGSVPGTIIAHYPFSGNANDLSGHQLHGQPSGGTLYVPDFWGNANSAIRLDGINDNVTVPNDPLLNFQQAITVSCWFSPLLLPDHEVFLLSHGSWQNRWKISITPDKKIRWTVNSLTTIADLDSDLSVAVDSIYHLAVTYDGSLLALYINGQLRSYKPLSGLIRMAAIPFLIGQILPGTLDFNFKGRIDEVKIFDYSLNPQAVQSLYDNIPTAVTNPFGEGGRMQISPNPVGDRLTVTWPALPEVGNEISVYDLIGRLVEKRPVGQDSTVEFDAKNWKPGVYVVVVQSTGGLASGRFVKM